MTDLSMLALSALGILRERPQHPYEVYKTMIDRRQDRLVKVRPGTLYHAIARLAEAGMVEVVGVERDGNRPERTTYQITAAGRSVLRSQVERMAAHPVWEYPSFPVALSELHNLDRDDALTALTARRDLLRAERDFQATAIAELTAARLPAVYWLEVGYTHRLLTAEVDWLTALIDELDSGALDWSDRTNPATTSWHHHADPGWARTSPLFPDLPPRKADR